MTNDMPEQSSSLPPPLRRLPIVIGTVLVGAAAQPKTVNPGESHQGADQHGPDHDGKPAERRRQG